jgi:GNAT superfamily N-acetyltransferase
MMDTSRPVAVSLGVAQVWVHPAWRRCGIAVRLLDAARAHAIYAHETPREAPVDSTAPRDPRERRGVGSGARSDLKHMGAPLKKLRSIGRDRFPRGLLEEAH